MSSAPGSFTYKAGTASICITPDEPLWMAGYAVRTAPARGKISDLYASALALEDETGQRFVMASADIIAITLRDCRFGRRRRLQPESSRSLAALIGRDAYALWPGIPTRQAGFLQHSPRIRGSVPRYLEETRRCLIASNRSGDC